MQCVGRDFVVSHTGLNAIFVLTKESPPHDETSTVGAIDGTNVGGGDTGVGSDVVVGSEEGAGVGNGVGPGGGGVGEGGGSEVSAHRTSRCRQMPIKGMDYSDVQHFRVREEVWEGGRTGSTRGREVGRTGEVGTREVYRVRRSRAHG